MERFSTRYPGVTLTVEEITQDRIEAKLGADELDVGIAFADVRAADIDSRALFDETLSLVVGDPHPRAGQQTPLTTRDLQSLPLVLLTTAFATRLHIDRYLREHAITPPIAIEVSSIGAIIEIVRSGRLATVLPDAVSREQQGLSSIPLTPALPRRTAALLRRNGAYRTAAVRAFTEVVSTWDYSAGWPT